MQNGFYCQKHGEHLCFKEDGELIGLMDGKCKLSGKFKEMFDREVCTDCFTEPVE